LRGLEEYIFGEVYREIKIMKKVGNNNKFSEYLLPLSYGGFKKLSELKRLCFSVTIWKWEGY
jgi:hypothetical protein